ncbi:MAG TPA: phosphoribosylglycinamide formyltransferase [Longimicrobiaceae bacterium]|nr:phosphoribosylglycinamide formyltransferase [Longimicrobiaceae bacterium]
MPARVAVLASGGGTTLQALIDRLNARSGAPARVHLVIANRPDAGALRRAEEAGIPTGLVSARLHGPDAVAGRMQALLAEHAIDLVVLAGYLQLVPREVVLRYAGRILNIHPALLPAFGGPGMYGIRVHQAVLASGATVSGATVHLVDEVYDRGRILAQWPVPVLPGDTPEALASRVLRVEHLLLPAAVEALAAGGTGELPMPHDPLAFELTPAPAPGPEQLHHFTAALRRPTDDRRPTTDDS